MKIVTLMTKNFARRLACGFGAVGVVLIVLMGVIRWRMQEVGDRARLVIDTRLPTVQASQQLLSGVNQSLAGLRGYMLLGKEAFKTERMDAWAKEINPAMQQLQTLAARWTTPQNKHRSYAVGFVSYRFSLNLAPGCTIKIPYKSRT